MYNEETHPCHNTILTPPLQGGDYKYKGMLNKHPFFVVCHAVLTKVEACCMLHIISVI